MKNMSG